MAVSLGLFVSIFSDCRDCLRDLAGRSPGIAIILSGIACYLVTSFAVAGAIYCRGSAQAFWIGVVVPFAFESFSISLVFAEPFTLTWNELVYFLFLDAKTWNAISSNYYLAPPTSSEIDVSLLHQLHGFHKKVVFVTGISIAAGLLSMAVRWWVVPTRRLPVAEKQEDAKETA